MRAVLRPESCPLLPARSGLQRPGAGQDVVSKARLVSGKSGKPIEGARRLAVGERRYSRRSRVDQRTRGGRLHSPPGSVRIATLRGAAILARPRHSRRGRADPSVPELFMVQLARVALVLPAGFGGSAAAQQCCIPGVSTDGTAGTADARPSWDTPKLRAPLKGSVVDRMLRFGLACVAVLAAGLSAAQAAQSACEISATPSMFIFGYCCTPISSWNCYDYDSEPGFEVVNNSLTESYEVWVESPDGLLSGGPWGPWQSTMYCGVFAPGASTFIYASPNCWPPEWTGQQTLNVFATGCGLVTTVAYQVNPPSDCVPRLLGGNHSRLLDCGGSSSSVQVEIQNWGSYSAGWAWTWEASVPPGVPVSVTPTSGTLQWLEIQLITLSADCDVAACGDYDVVISLES
jgi:hypothetical protein